MNDFWWDDNDIIRTENYPMLDYTVDLTSDDIVEVVSKAIEPFCGVCYQAQDNRVPMPLEQFCILTPITYTRLSTTRVIDNPLTEQAKYKEIRKLDMQLDIYGKGGSERAIAIETAFRSNIMYEKLHALDERITPLYSTSAVQASMINKEMQWQERYMVMLTLQTDITLVAPQDYFDSIEFTLYEVDSETLGKAQHGKKNSSLKRF